jgi:hypothetical protein
MGAEGFLYIILAVVFFLVAKGIIVLRSVRLDLTRHDIADNKTADSRIDVNNIALFISDFLSIPPWSFLCKIPLFLFIFIKKELLRLKIVNQIIPTLLSLYKCLK